MRVSLAVFTLNRHFLPFMTIGWKPIELLLRLSVGASGLSCTTTADVDVDVMSEQFCATHPHIQCSNGWDNQWLTEQQISKTAIQRSIDSKRRQHFLYWQRRAMPVPDLSGTDSITGSHWQSLPTCAHSDRWSRERSATVNTDAAQSTKHNLLWRSVTTITTIPTITLWLSTL